MNYAMIVNILGWLLIVESLLMAPSALVALIYREKAGVAILLTMVICSCIGAVMALARRPKKKRIYAKEGMVITALTWFAYSILGALPFRISGYIPGMIDAVFEMASGFTTTGASILSDVEALPHCLLFWRSFSHWVGGMGILVFAMAVVPLAGGGSNMFMMKAESPGPSIKKIVPKVRGTAGLLYKIYIAITLIQLVLLLVGRMPLFDALCITFGTAGTGGFSIANSGCADYSIYQQVVITVFMIIFGTNFSAWYLLMKRRFKEALGISEVIVYYAIVAASILLITFNICGSYSGFGLALKDAAFQVGSIITTTGYATTDFNLWPSFSKWILVLLMFCGACAGSTGGGIKVSRIQIAFKTVIKEIDSVTHPNNVRKIKIDGKQLEHSVLRGTNVFFMAYLLIYGLSVLLISLDNFDLETNFTAVAATLNNIGPGLAGVGPTQNFSGYSPFSTCVLIFDMIAGRLELFPVLALLSINTWKEGGVIAPRGVFRKKQEDTEESTLF